MKFIETLFTGGQRHVISFRNARVNGDLVKQALDLHGRFRLKARGGSMYPLIRDGELIEIVPLDPEKVRFGDIIMTVFNNERYVIHRVVRLSRRGKIIYTKGDSIDAVDPPAGPEEFLGIVNWYAHNGRIIRSRRGLVARMAPLLAVCSLVSLGLTELIGNLFRQQRGTMTGPRKTIARICRVPGWILAKLVVEISYLGSKQQRDNGRDRDRNDDYLP